MNKAKITKREFAISFLGIAIFISLLFFCGSVDCDEAELEYKNYCEQVKSGVWPAYKGECK